MRHIIAFSGGFDSTYALIKLAEKCGENDRILAVSLIHRLTGDAKLKREADARVMILAELRKKYPKVDIESYDIDIHVPWGIGSADNGRGLAQPILWISNLVPLLKDGDEVTLGYILEDQATLHMDSIYKFWNSALSIQENKDVKLKLPLKYYTKVEILAILMQHYPEVVDHCVSCEALSSYYRKSNCGNCVPCSHLRNALICIIADNNLKHEIHEKAKQMLADRFDLEVEVKVRGAEQTALSETRFTIKEDEKCES